MWCGVLMPVFNIFSCHTYVYGILLARSEVTLSKDNVTTKYFHTALILKHHGKTCSASGRLEIEIILLGREDDKEHESFTEEAVGNPR
jgi:hypothetical protein